MRFEDYFEIQQLMARYGHVVDAGGYGLETIFTEDAVQDATMAGGPRAVGIDAIAEIIVGLPLRELRPRPPGNAAMSHHATNLLIVREAADDWDVQTKYFRVAARSILMGRQLDTVVRTPDGLRIASRTIFAHG